MKLIYTLLVGLFVSTEAIHAEPETLLPTEINIVLGKLKPRMGEAEMLTQVKEHYPEATSQVGEWSGHSGLLDFKLNKRYSISLTAISKIGNHEDRRAHENLTFYVFDWQLNRRIDISFHTWGEGDKAGK